MNNRTQNELIEQYLSGTLSPEDRQALETRMALDEDFRELVALQRQMHEEFADPQKLKLRDAMVEILQESPTPAKYGWIRGLGITLSVFLAVWLGWRWLTAPKSNAGPAIREEIKSSPTELPMVVPDSNTRPSWAQDTAKERPLALADPAAFKPNRAFEDRVGGNLRAIDGAAEMQSPRVGENFALDNGRVKISFQGTAPASSDTAQYPLVLKIYANQSDGYAPLFYTSPPIKNRNAATWAFSSVQQLRLKPGLYYFTLERRADEDLIFVGKFTVGGR